MEIACRLPAFSLFSGSMIYRFGEFELDADRFELRRGGEALAAEPQVLSLLFHLARSGGRLVSKDEIVDEIWGGRIVSDAAITSRLKSARHLLGDDGERQETIRTVRGKGVRFLPQVVTTLTQAEEGPTVQRPRTEPPPQKVRFCQAPDGASLAYSVVGDGPPLVRAAHWLNHLEHEWESPIWRHWLDILVSHHRLLRYDERGSGLSDRNVDSLSFELMVEDLERVIEAADFDTFDLLGIAQGCPLAIAYAVKHPKRVRRMVLYGGYAAGWRIRDNAQMAEMREIIVRASESGWDRKIPAYGQLLTSLYFPDATEEEARSFVEAQHKSVTLETALRQSVVYSQIDVTDLLGRVEVPTLILHSREDAVVDVEAGRQMAKRIAGAQFVELDSNNHLILEREPTWRRLVRELHSFLSRDELTG